MKVHACARASAMRRQAPSYMKNCEPAMKTRTSPYGGSVLHARAQGEEAAINLYKGKRILSVYTPIDWPEMLTYQTPEGGLKEKWFS